MSVAQELSSRTLRRVKFSPPVSAGISQILLLGASWVNTGATEQDRVRERREREALVKLLHNKFEVHLTLTMEGSVRDCERARWYVQTNRWNALPSRRRL